MASRTFALTLVAVFSALLMLALAQGPAMAQAPTFVSRVVTTPLSRQGPLPQDVEGIVVDRQGRAIPGMRVRVFSPGWEAYDTTKGNGAFRFTLTEGRFSLQLPDRASQTATIQVDGWSSIWIEFREVAPEATPSRQTTASPTPTPTETPTPTPTSITPPALLTPTPTTIATVRAVSTPTPVASPQATPTPRVGASPASVLSLEYWVQPLLYGAIVGAVMVLLGAAIFLLRR